MMPEMSKTKKASKISVNNLPEMSKRTRTVRMKTTK